ncbi:PREDICTED: cysteine-rich secretory protein 1 [Chrysochloris asiatica]|uniref:Cysteine-rich secretory protein 1 n=1 Tax=Chrysochloris asiatica TaxID=185453 RepID=A0A9B0THA4_CHRAS|nr:PREDICTED: cysteine-rich secretory protein 1 [Chrysochloris asiatica]
MTMKHFLFWIAAADFLLVLAIRGKTWVPYKTLLTTLPDVQEEIVNVHNSFRRNVTPSASNMLKMSWNEDAAANARTLSSQCNPENSYIPDRRVGEKFCGENILFTYSSIPWSDVIGIWYDESQYFTYGILNRTNKRIDHYTQVVWATSYLIGCSVTLCHQRRSKRFLYICHYCHEGNLVHLLEPYKAGAPCSQCPDACEDKLCSKFYTFSLLKIGCSHVMVRTYCKASCLCTTEIK